MDRNLREKISNVDVNVYLHFLGEAHIRETIVDEPAFDDVSIILSKDEGDTAPIHRKIEKRGVYRLQNPANENYLVAVARVAAIDCHWICALREDGSKRISVHRQLFLESMKFAGRNNLDAYRQCCLLPASIRKVLRWALWFCSPMR